MRRKLLLTGAGLLALMVVALTGIIVSIRSSLQRFSDDAVSQFPGDRAEALIRLVDCDTCNLGDRNHAVWALGQMVEARSISVLRKHFDGQPCQHTTRLCQYELRKAIRMMETRHERNGPAWRLIAKLHQPWH